MLSFRLWLLLSFVFLSILCVYNKGNCATENLLANLDTITNSVTQFTEILTFVYILLQNVFGIWWVIYLIHFMICIPVLVNFAYIVFTKLALFRMNCFAASDHIAGTVKTHRMSVGSMSTPLAVNAANRWFMSALIEVPNTFMAGTGLPATSSMIISPLSW